MMTKLTTYSSEFKLQQAAIAFIVHNMAHTDEIREIFSIFQLIDESGDGRITKEELIKGLTIHNPSLQNIEDEVDKIFTNLDTDQNGFIEFEEFARVLIDKKKLLTQENLAFSFNFFDKDGSGDITVQELKDVFGKSANNDKLQKLIDEIDIDKDGVISFLEFTLMMKKIIV